MMSRVQDNIISRRSIYRFEESPVEMACLETAFEAARHAPCHKQTHPWKFYVLGKEARSSMIPEVEKLAVEKAAGKGENEVREGIQKAISKILSPPVLIAVTSAVTPEDDFREMEDYAATACSVQNLVLSLWDQGIGTQWSTGGITRSDFVYRALEISPVKEKIVGFLKAGYPAAIPQREKKSIAEIREYLP
ncbi:MAG TPA: nitroreductase [Candidatus Poseidoniales archaeon]|nr:MAG TPA: nitroreductase [Candidatus Poseidoniales archaeon]